MIGFLGLPWGQEQAWQASGLCSAQQWRVGVQGLALTGSLKDYVRLYFCL